MPQLEILVEPASQLGGALWWRRESAAGLALSVAASGGCARWRFLGAIAAALKIKAGTNEVISTLLLSFIAVWLLYWTVQSEHLLRKPMTNSATLPESLEIPDTTKLPLLTGDYSFPLHRNPQLRYT
jgi:ABC-type uncharacterized transport system permease subunit